MMNAPARMTTVVLTALLPILPATAVAEQESPYLIKERIIPPEYQITADFLEFLKPTEDARTAFDAQIAPRWNVDRLLSFIASGGFTATDLNRNEGRPRSVSIKEIRSAVASRKGLTFQMLSHVGYIYAQPYKQYSELHFQPMANDGVAVHLADWYQITFARQAGALKVNRIDYLMREGH
jgi:hypothetical protein